MKLSDEQFDCLIGTIVILAIIIAIVYVKTN